ncbi:MAG: hypothetical protein GTO18_09305 [Anaerolineales bacterium]|nr:hypothetical protein [Anaerolineales bacterium]
MRANADKFWTNKTQASLIWAICIPEAILRLLLNEMAFERTLEPPPGYDPSVQGSWDETYATYTFRRAIRITEYSRDVNRLLVDYDFGSLGRWKVDIQPKEVTIRKI